MSRKLSRLTDDEGTFLALLARIEPATAYQISKVYEESPVSNFGVSKGKIYPLIKRLKERKLVAAKQAKDLRGTERLSVTALGLEAIRIWVLDIRPSHLLLEDPLRTKAQSLELLSREQQLGWATSAKAELEAKLKEVREYSKSVTLPYKAEVVDNAVTALKARIAWLNRVHSTLTKAK